MGDERFVRFDQQMIDAAAFQLEVDLLLVEPDLTAVCDEVAAGLCFAGPHQSGSAQPGLSGIAKLDHHGVVCGLEGNLLRSKILGYNGPRRDFYATEQWQKIMAERPYLSNVKAICLAGDKLRHTEIIAVNHQVNPVIETLLLRFPDIQAGRGPHPSIEAALAEAERNANGVFRRYNEQVNRWKRGDG